jgi:hypothetical protein
LKTTVGPNPLATNILIKRESQKLTKSLKEAEKGKKAPNQQLGLGAVYQAKTIQRRRNKKLEDSTLYGLKPI